MIGTGSDGRSAKFLGLASETVVGVAVTVASTLLIASAILARIVKVRAILSLIRR